MEICALLSMAAPSRWIHAGILRRSSLVLICVALIGRSSDAGQIYRLEAVTGFKAGSALTGSITLPDSLKGKTVWNLEDATAFRFHSTYADGLDFGPAELTVANDVRFDLGVGAEILSPVLPDASPGFAPDWRIDTVSGGREYFLGIGTDLALPLWNLVDPAQIGSVDYSNAPSTGPTAWRLVRVPEPPSLALGGFAAAILLRFRPAHHNF